MGKTVKGKIKGADTASNNVQANQSRFQVNENTKDYESSNIVFSLERVVNGKHCFSKLDKHHKAFFAEAMFRRKDFTWTSIQQEDRHGLGCEKIARSSIKVAIPKEIPDDTEYFLAFRYKAKHPMVGIRRQNIFYVLWFDHDFKVYPH
ncbi:hypothetical protein ACCH70_004215 [Vibrio vulnificus]|uniref:hypothetical protein n=1 Tax=Vibrio TaxID=662 RepID=UPI00192CC47F|nr:MULTISPECIES: hypothetical protein [Vibrio]HDM8146207.1 hypothetical protein [Vibrio harveyi]HDY8146124.1 hypothetical protein [Vibrio vulnificus]MCG7517883.1 hypothetical protein [Vibrio sp. MMH1-50]GHY16739.1 hypothetical protein VCSRO21_3538 [Vibrio cholerae]HDM8183086.1 hypothetical protein [Vibrio harveyi]